MSTEGFLIWLLGVVSFVVLSVASIALERNRFVRWAQPLFLFVALAWCLGVPVVYLFKVMV